MKEFIIKDGNRTAQMENNRIKCCYTLCVKKSDVDKIVRNINIFDRHKVASEQAYLHCTVKSKGRWYLTVAKLVSLYTPIPTLYSYINMCENTCRALTRLGENK